MPSISLGRLLAIAPATFAAGAIALAAYNLGEDERATNARNKAAHEQIAVAFAEDLEPQYFFNIPSHTLNSPAYDELENKTIFAADHLRVPGDYEIVSSGRKRILKLLIACAIDQNAKATPFFLEVRMKPDRKGRLIDIVHPLEEGGDGHTGMTKLCQEVGTTFL